MQGDANAVAGEGPKSPPKRLKKAENGHRSDFREYCCWRMRPPFPRSGIHALLLLPVADEHEWCVSARYFQAFSLLFKKTAPALINDAPDALCDGRQNPGEFKLNPDLSVFDIYKAARCLSRHAHSKVESIAGPHSAIDRHQPSERRDHLIDARFQTTPRLCPAKPMRNGNDDRVGHNLPFMFERLAAKNHVVRGALSCKAAGATRARLKRPVCRSRHGRSFRTRSFTGNRRLMRMSSCRVQDSQVNFLEFIGE